MHGGAPARDPGRRSSAHLCAIGIGIAIAYACLAQVTFAAAQAGTPAFFPAAGLTFGVMMWLPGRDRWVAAAAIVVAEIAVDLWHGIDVDAALWFATANVVEPVVGVLVLSRLLRGARLRLIVPRMVLLAATAMAASTAVGALVGATGATVTSGAAWSETWFGWWTGDLLGQLVLAPLFLVIAQYRHTITAPIAALAWSTGLVAVSTVVFFVTDPGAEWMVLPVVGATAILSGTFGASLANLVVAGMTFAAISLDRPLFAADLELGASGLGKVQLFLIVMAVTGHLLAAERQARADLEASLVASESAFRSVVGNAPVSIMEIDADDGSVLSWNPASERIFGWSSEEVLGRPLPIVPPELWEQHEAAREAARDDPAQRALEMERLHRDGTRLHVSVITSPRRRSDGRLVFTSVLQDITSSKERREALERRLETDALTGLANRDRLTRELDGRIDPSRARTPVESVDRQAAVLFCDLNGFKQVNDTLGHRVGDRLLQLAAGRLRSLTRPTDVVARLGGDEFVILADVDSRAGAETLASRVERAFGDPFDVDGEQVQVSISIGVAIADGNAASESVLERADAAMYDHKRSSRSTATSDRRESSPA